MISRILKLSTIILLLNFLTAGCQKDELLKLTADGRNPVIKYEREGVELKFYLLNERGEPSTTFDAGENFTFFLLKTLGIPLLFLTDFSLTKKVFVKLRIVEIQAWGKLMKSLFFIKRLALQFM